MQNAFDMAAQQLRAAQAQANAAPPSVTVPTQPQVPGGLLQKILDAGRIATGDSYEPGGAAESPKGFSFPSGPRAQNGYNSRKWTNSMDDSDSSDAYAYDNAYTTEAPAGTGIGRM